MKLLTALFVLALATGAHAQNFPDNKTVRFISGVTPGAASDTMARILAEKLQGKWGSPVIVEHKLCAGGLVGAKWVAEQAEPDGHTIMMYASAFTVSTLLSPNVLNPKELQAVATVATIPTVMITQPNKYKNVQDFVAQAKANPGKTVCSDAGLGSATHMAFERFRFAAGFEVLNVHTKGPGEALTEVIAGRADCYFALVFQAKKMVEAGKVGALVLSGPKRSALLPELQTTEEAGESNSAYNFWVGALVSSKTPRPIVELLHKEITALVELREPSAYINKHAVDTLLMSIKDFESMIARELDDNAALIKKAKIPINN